MARISGPEVPPLSGGKAKQIVIFLHGLGADGNDLISLSEVFAGVLPDCHFYSPNAPEPCDMAPFGYQWFSLRNWSMASMLDGVKRAVPVLNDFIDEKLALHGLDESSLALVGFSQGTMTGLFTALRRPKPIAGMLGFSGAMIAGETLKDEIKSRPEVMLVHGNMDMVVPFVALSDAEKWLKENNVPVEVHSCFGLGHGIDERGLELGKNFLKRVLK